VIKLFLYIFVLRLLTFQGRVVSKIVHSFCSQNRYKNPEVPLKVTSGFLVLSHHINLVSVAGQFLATLQFKRLLDQINASIGHERKFPSGAFLSLFFWHFIESIWIKFFYIFQIFIKFRCWHFNSNFF